MAVVACTYLFPLLLLLAALRAACLAQACGAYIPPFPAKLPFAADYPASLPAWSVLLYLALALSRVCLGAGTFSKVPCFARSFLELPFLSHLAPLPSFLVLLPCPCLCAHFGWVCCMLCVFCVCFVIVCAKLTSLECLPLLLLLYGFGVSLLGCFVLLLCLCLHWCCFYTCLHLFANLCCLDSCWCLFIGLGSSALLLAPICEFVFLLLLPVPVPLTLVFALLLLAELVPVLLAPFSDLC